MIWHYEYIEGRSNGRCWRVADENDDFIDDYVTEGEARDFVVDHNRQHKNSWPRWRYGE